MPLRDHFRPPVSARSSWEGFHGMWPATMVQQLVRVLPGDYTAEPRVHLGSYFEIDVCTYEDDEPKAPKVSTQESSGSVATATWAPPQPTFTANAELADQYEYEVLVYDQSRGRLLVAAVEIVSPANKDRPETAVLSSPNALPCSKRACACRSSIWSRRAISICMSTCSA